MTAAGIHNDKDWSAGSLTQEMLDAELEKIGAAQKSQLDVTNRDNAAFVEWIGRNPPLSRTVTEPDDTHLYMAKPSIPQMGPAGAFVAILLACFSIMISLEILRGSFFVLKSILQLTWK